MKIAEGTESLYCRFESCSRNHIMRDIECATKAIDVGNLITCSSFVTDARNAEELNDGRNGTFHVGKHSLHR